MQENWRQFEVTDPFGRTWKVEFRWQQNAISIRHCDAVDCKYYLTAGDEKQEIVIALMHADLLKVAAERGREVTDAWCMRLAGLHLRHLISTWEDMEKQVASVPFEVLDRYSREIENSDRVEKDRVTHAH